MSRDWKKFFSNKNNYVVILLIGVLFLVMLLPVGGGTTGKGNASSGNFFFEEMEGERASAEGGGVREDSFGETLDFTQAYCRMLENKMAELLSQVEGIGRSEVLITMQYSEEKYMEEDTLIKTQVPRVQGVMVVAEGAGKGNVDLKITQIVQALLDVDVHKIAIAKMETP